MEEYNDGVEDSVNLQLETGEWGIREATQLIKEYRAAKTAHAQNRLRPRIEYMLKKMAFEQKALAKLMGEQDETL